jgi:LacI family transcriptional regulator
LTYQLDLDRICKRFKYEKPMGYTLKDIASLSELSVATVSRILNGQPGVKDSTRKKVLDITRELNYLPNAIAKSMKTKQTRTIGLVIADITNPSYADIAKTVEVRARKNNYTVIICNTENKTSVQNKIIDSLRERRVDGFIFASVKLRDKPVRDLLETGIPCVFTGRHLEGYRGTFMGSDNLLGVRLVMEHLHQLGHRKIAFISGPREFSTGMERLRAYLEISKELAIETPPHLVQDGGYDRTKTSEIVRELLELPSPPTAVFAANDLMALQVLDCVLDVGLRVPEDLSVAGYDDIPVAAHHSIQLTTVDGHFSRLALLAIENLMSRLEGVLPSDEPTRIILEPHLRVRRTTGKPRQSPILRRSRDVNTSEPQ